MDGYLFSSTFCFVEDILPPRVRHGILCSLDDLELKANAISYSSSHLFLFFVLVFLFINMPYIHLSSQTINPTNKRYVLKFQHKRNGGEREREREYDILHIYVCIGMTPHNKTSLYCRMDAQLALLVVFRFSHSFSLSL